MKKQAHVWYSGRVVGVGFRLTAEELAQRMGVRGWVKNLRDGRVELVAEAEGATVQRFLNEIQRGPMKNFIQNADISWSRALGTFDEFEIRYF